MSMLSFIMKRLVALLLLTFIVITTTFVTFRVIPDDPLAVQVSPRMSPDVREAVARQCGFDKPLSHQYIIYLIGMLSGNMGISFYWQAPVADILKGPLIFSIVLMSGAFLCATAIDSLSTALLSKRAAIVNIAFYLTPFLFLGLLLMYLFASKMDLFPLGGMKSPEIWGPGTRTSAGEKLADLIYHLFLPTILLIVWLMVGFLPLVKTTSAGVIEEKKALLPAGISTLISASALFLGATATEIMFSWPGVYSIFVEASLNYDYPLLQGAVIAGLLLCLIVAVSFEILYAAAASLKWPFRTILR